uniref:Uncharacterized protein n=1 Tax=Myotis myotis TaxID=51298 RepID=A0A7J7QTJ0_MYOMY|nr:hypothetical protein mMyoMyo1_011828 [Myotis myotis]
MSGAGVGAGGELPRAGPRWVQALWPGLCLSSPHPLAIATSLGEPWEHPLLVLPLRLWETTCRKLLSPGRRQRPARKKEIGDLVIACRLGDSNQHRFCQHFHRWTELLSDPGKRHRGLEEAQGPGA